MSEEMSKPKKKEVSYQEVLEALKTKGKDDPGAMELFTAWIIQEEELAAEAKGGRANVVVSMSQAFLLSEAGLQREALDSYRDALYQARQGGETDLESMILTEIEKLEKASYDEDELLEEAIWARDSRLADAHDEVARNKEKALDEEGMVKKFLNNFKGHLPGGYKRAGGIKKLEEDIDSTIERLKMKREEMMSWQDEEPSSKEDREKWFGILKTLYIEMRRLGYNHYPDLTS